MSNLLLRARHVLRGEGLTSLLARVKHRFYNRPLLDESWYLLNYFLRPSRSCIKTIQGAKMHLDLNDPGINRDLFLYGYREPECSRIYRDELREGMTVLDIGANVGYFVLIGAQGVGDTGKICAVEPAPGNFKMLMRNLELNGLAAKVESHNMAVSDRVGKVAFELAEASNHHRLSVEGSGATTIEVDATTVDELARGRAIDMVRMDTEGAEWVILQGMRELLASGRPLKMFVEVHPKLIGQYQGDLGEWLRVLAESGFRVKYLVVWEPESHSVIPYIKGRMARERPTRYDRPLAELLAEEETGRILLSRTGHSHGAGYKLFLER